MEAKNTWTVEEIREDIERLKSALQHSVAFSQWLCRKAGIDYADELTEFGEWLTAGRVADGEKAVTHDGELGLF